MIILKGELNSADEQRKTVLQKGEEDHVHNPLKDASDNAGLVYGTQGYAFVAGQDR